MTSETPADPPKTAAKSTESAETPSKASASVEYDDFGLPIRKARVRTPVEDSEDSEDESFEDAVASNAASKEDVRRAKENTVEEPSKPAVSKEETKTDNVDKESSATIDQDAAIEGQPKLSEVKTEASSRKDEDIRAPATQTVDNSQIESETLDETKKPTQDAEVQQEEKQPQTNGHHVDPEEKPEEGKATSQPQHGETESKASSSGHAQRQSVASVSEWSHQRAMMQPKNDLKEDDDGEWQTMPAYARYDMYDDDNRLIAKENAAELEDMHGYGNVGGAAKGYTRVIMDDDVDSQTSMDDNTAYLFKEKSTTLAEEDEDARDPLAQMQTTKNILTEGQRVAYVGLVRLAIVEIENKFSVIDLKKSKKSKKTLELVSDSNKMWAQKIMLNVYGHMDIDSSEQIMIEQLSQHGVVPADLTPALMANARVKNPATDNVETVDEKDSTKPDNDKSEKLEEEISEKQEQTDDVAAKPSASSTDAPPAYALKTSSASSLGDDLDAEPLPAYHEEQNFDYSDIKEPSELPKTKHLDIDLRWTVLCDLFLVLISGAVYDARSRELLQQVGKYLSVDWIEICRFEKRVTDALEMQEQADRENWNETDHMEARAKAARNKRLAFMGLATVGGGLVIGLSAGLLAPVIGAGLAAGFGTVLSMQAPAFLAGAGGMAMITTTGVVTGSTIGVRAANRRTGSVKTFEYKPLHNNKRTHLIITLAGWMNGKVDDVRLPFSTVDPLMGDMYSVLWEPEMLRSMGDTINILATEALTQGLQQVLASTVLTALMSAMMLPLALTKLSYLIDNPWIVSQARADMAGLILADSIMDRNLGARPITLVGFSLGARVIFSCLKELAKCGAFGLVQNVFMFGSPIVANNEDYIKARSVIPGRFVNGYATNDWILGYLFRATSGGVARVAGLAAVEVQTVENVNVTELVPGHMAYRSAMPKLLREVGWEVESDEFTEIEDPDPENHEKRQRELINEIEEARKELEKKNAEKEKKGKLSWWRKKKTDKKDWEVYDENSLQSQHKVIDQDQDAAKIAENHVMFDIDAIRKEVAMLAAESKEYNAESEFEIKEIKSTLPPMKIELPPASPYSNLRETKSYNDSLGSATVDPKSSSAGNLTPANGARTPSGVNGQNNRDYEEYDEFDDPGASKMEMTFDTSFNDTPPKTLVPRSPLPPLPDTPFPSGSSHNDQNAWGESSPVERPPLVSSKTEPHQGSSSNGTSSNAHLAPGYNAWADEFEDDFGKEKEVKMSFM